MASSKPTKITDLVESRSLAVDRTAGVIKGVKILGHTSANGREYSKAAVTKARGLYEGMRVNVDHPRKAGEARTVADRFGRLVNVREQGDGLYGDLEYLKAHPLAEMTAEAAERMPDQLGLSHNAEGRVVSHGGKQLVEEITKVRSVDLVSDPATVRGLFEGLNMEPEAMGGEPAPESGSGNAIKDAFNAEIMKIVNGDGDLQTKITGIKDLLKSLEQTMQKLSGEKPAAKPDGEGEGGGDEPKKTPEGAKPKADPTLAQLQEQIRQRDVKDEVRDLFESAGIKADPLQIKAACLLPTPEERKAFVEAMGRGSNGRPRSAGPLTAATPLTEGRQAAVPKDSKEFAALCR